jgi:hypothetical protein
MLNARMEEQDVDTARHTGEVLVVHLRVSGYARVPRMFGVKSDEGDCPLLLERPFAKSTIGSTQHVLPLANAMGELDPGDRHRGIGE